MSWLPAVLTGDDPARSAVTMKQSFMAAGDGLLPTACYQPVDNVRHLLRSRWIRTP